MNPEIDDPVLHQQQVEEICDLYHAVSELNKQGIRVVFGIAGVSSLLKCRRRKRQADMTITPPSDLRDVFI
ncbi:hypothetical protein BVY04_02795 [bacterium M21]|nr:hypothetical protein BVY04_02795 [bacterium M21]